MAHRPPSTAGASGDKTGATALVTVIIAVHPGGPDENWADPYALNRPGQRHRAGHPWPPPHCADPETGRVVWDSAQRGGSRVRAALRLWRPAALRWRRLPAAV